MEPKRRWNSTHEYLRALLLPLAVFGLFVAFLVLGAGRTGDAALQEGRRVLEEAAWKATVQCYALEGSYAPDVAYLEQNYGLQVDSDRYIVHYEAFASNVLPTIFVLEKGKSGAP